MAKTKEPKPGPTPAAADDEQPKVPALVKMVRDAEMYPAGPFEADVHPDEVANYSLGGWVRA